MVRVEVTKGSRVYQTEQAYGRGPRELHHCGRRLFRFMDSIYLDRPSDELNVETIKLLNDVRRPLLDRSEIAHVNERVRYALAQGLQAVGAHSVLEWGCGYHPMKELLDGVDYAGLDIDPGVVEHNRNSGVNPMYLADRDLVKIATASRAAIVSPFVFHFRIPWRHIATMRRVLEPDGVLIANVYRRSPRARSELKGAFRRAGFDLMLQSDPARLCVDHEFWCLYPNRSRANQARARQALLAVTEAVSRPPRSAPTR